MSLFKRGSSPNWYYSFRMGGKLYSGSTRTTNRAKAAQIENKRRNEVHAILEMGESEPIKLKDAVDAFLRTKARSGNYRNYRTACDRLMGSVLSNDGNKSVVELPGFSSECWLHDLSQRQLQRVITDRESRYSAATLQQEIMSLTQLIKNAGNLEFRTPNLIIPKIKVRSNRLRWLSDDEENDVLRELTSASEKIGNTDGYDMAIVMLDTGCRIGECQALPWSSVDLTEKTIKIWRSKVRNGMCQPVSHS